MAMFEFIPQEVEVTRDIMHMSKDSCLLVIPNGEKCVFQYGVYVLSGLDKSHIFKRSENDECPPYPPDSESYECLEKMRDYLVRYLSNGLGDMGMIAGCVAVAVSKAEQKGESEDEG